MSILIKGMNMPKNCAECPCEHYECMLLEKDAEDIMPYFTGDKRHPDCPLIELPPHGRLVDADALLASNFGGEPFKSVIRRILMQAPTIIEANV